MAFCVRFARVVYDDMATSAEVATNSVAMTMANIVSFFLYILGIQATAPRAVAPVSLNATR